MQTEQIFTFWENKRGGIHSRMNQKPQGLRCGQAKCCCQCEAGRQKGFPVFAIQGARLLENLRKHWSLRSPPSLVALHRVYIRSQAFFSPFYPYHTGLWILKTEPKDRFSSVSESWKSIRQMFKSIYQSTHSSLRSSVWMNRGCLKSDNRSK